MPGGGEAGGENAAWVTVEVPLPPPRAFEFATRLERLLRLNPHLQIEAWTEEPGPFAPGKRWRLKALNEMNGLRYDVALTLEELEPGSRFLASWDCGLKRALEVSVAPHGDGAAVTLKEHYHSPEGPQREERLKEVDASLTPWGVALRRHLLAQRRWGWLPFYQPLRERFWLSMTPGQRRIGRLLIWVTVLEFAVFLVVVAFFAAAR
jgi:hypothetical protein